MSMILIAAGAMSMLVPVAAAAGLRAVVTGTSAIKVPTASSTRPRVSTIERGWLQIRGCVRTRPADNAAHRFEHGNACDQPLLIALEHRVLLAIDPSYRSLAAG